MPRAAASYRAARRNRARADRQIRYWHLCTPRQSWRREVVVNTYPTQQRNV